MTSLPCADTCIDVRPGQAAHATTDLEANLQANRARDTLFRAIGQATPVAA